MITEAATSFPRYLEPGKRFQVRAMMSSVRPPQQVLAPPSTGDWQNLPEKRAKPWQPGFCGYSRAIVGRDLRLLSMYHYLHFISEERDIQDNFAIHPNYAVSQ